MYSMALFSTTNPARNPTLQLQSPSRPQEFHRGPYSIQSNTIFLNIENVLKLRRARVPHADRSRSRQDQESARRERGAITLRESRVIDRVCPNCTKAGFQISAHTFRDILTPIEVSRRLLGHSSTQAVLWEALNRRISARVLHW